MEDTPADIPRFCAHCGASLDQKQQDHAREIDLAAAVADRVSQWVKILGIFVAVPSALLVAALVVFGFSKWNDFNERVNMGINTAVSRVQSRVDKLNEQIVPVEKRISEIESNIVLTFGSEGAPVTRLQARLQQLGYFREPITGRFGLSTEEAVRRFEADHKLRVDGAAGKDIFLLLWPANAKQ